MKRDDIALFWQSGEDAGIYATGKLISEPYSTSSNATDDHRVNVTYDQLLAVPLLRSTLTDHPVLRNLDVLNRPWGRNAFRVDDAEWSALQSLISEQGV
jgi:5-methylcytosine-specific restriction protein B